MVLIVGFFWLAICAVTVLFAGAAGRAGRSDEAVAAQAFAQLVTAGPVSRERRRGVDRRTTARGGRRDTDRPALLQVV